MKKILYIFLVSFVSLFILVPKTLAQPVRDTLSQTTPSLTLKERIGGLSSQMVSKTGDYVEISRDVRGDLHIAGGEVGVFSRIQGDLLILGGKVLVDGEVDQNLRVVGGEVIVRGKVGRNATVLGGKVEVEKSAQISGGLLAAGGDVLVDEGARVVGQKIIRGASKEGFRGKREAIKGLSRFFGTISSLTLAIKWLSILIVGLLLVRFFPKTLKRLLEATEKKFGEKLVWGTVLAIVVPIVAIFALFTVIGASLGVLVLAVLAIAWYVSKLAAMTFSGYFLLHKASGKRFKIFEKKPSLYASFLLGMLVFIILGVVPVFGWLAKLLLILACFGALTQEKLVRYKKAEK